MSEHQQQQPQPQQPQQQQQQRQPRQQPQRQPQQPVFQPAAPDQQPPRGGFNPIMMFKPFAYLFIMLGLLLVISAHGCEEMAQHSAKAANNDYALAIAKYQNNAEADQASITAQIDAIQDQEDKSSDDTKQIIKLRKELSEKRSDNLKKRRELEAGDWRELRFKAKVAVAGLDSTRWWLSGLFLIGSLILMAGLITVGFTGTGAERTICLIMIAIITFALFVGGVSIQAG